MRKYFISLLINAIVLIYAGNGNDRSPHLRYGTTKEKEFHLKNYQRYNLPTYMSSISQIFVHTTLENYECEKLKSL